MRTERRQYRFQYGLDEYVEGLGTWATGRFVREMLGERGWKEFYERTRSAFAERFSDPLNDFRHVLIGVGTKP